MASRNEFKQIEASAVTPTIASILDQVAELCKENGSEHFDRSMMVDNVYKNISIDLSEFKQLLLELDSEGEDKKTAAFARLNEKLMEWIAIEKDYFSGMCSVDDVELKELFANTLLFLGAKAKLASSSDLLTDNRLLLWQDTSRDESIILEYATRPSTETIFWGLGAHPASWDMGASVGGCASRAATFDVVASDVDNAHSDALTEVAENERAAAPTPR